MAQSPDLKSKSKFIQEFGYLVRSARTPVLVVSDESHRVYAEIVELTKTYLNHFAKKKANSEFKVYRWTITNRWMFNEEKVKLPEETAYDVAHNVLHIEEMEPCCIAVLENFHFYANRDNPAVIQAVRDISEHCQAQNKMVVFVNSSTEIPLELEAAMTVLHHDLPTEQDIGAEIDELVEDSGKKLKVTKEDKHKIIKACKGMNLSAIKDGLAYSIVKSGKINHKIVQGQKVEYINKTDMLTFVEKLDGFDMLGGLENLKDWTKSRRPLFTEAAVKYKLPAPRGILLGGPPGTGKSAAAQAIANGLDLPFIDWDMGAVYNKYVGESEANMRRAIKILESAAPCVVRLDEFDKVTKGMSGGGQGSEGSGVDSRLGGTLLKWMNDNDSLILLVATCNHPEWLGDEYLRAGRFDIIMSVDIPTDKELVEIVRVQLVRQHLQVDKYDIPAIAKAMKNFVGAEVACAITEAKLLCANVDRWPETKDIATCAKNMVPGYKRNKDQIDKIRAVMSQFAVSASKDDSGMPSDVKTKGGKWKILD